MSIDISRVARALCDLSAGSNFPLKLSHAQQCVAAAFGFKSLAAYQAAKKLETDIDDNGAFVIVENDLLASRGRELVEAADGVNLTALVRKAIEKTYPAASVHSSSTLRRVPAASAIAGLIGLDPIEAPDLDDARYQIVENKRGEVQGFLFNFDAPEWAEFGSHIRQRHGSLFVYAPASFLRLVKNCETPKRFYLHGDKHEDDPQQFFCRACDQFVDAAHFDSGKHNDNDHRSRYFDSLNRWDRGPARWKLSHRRPTDAPNIVAAKAVEVRRSAEAARSDFHCWIEQQTKRDDVIGDLAKDIMRDSKFPKHARTRSEVFGYIERTATWNGPITAAKEAWKEFEKSRKQTESDVVPARISTWPVGSPAINAIVLPPDQRAMLVPQLRILEVPGRFYWRFSDGDELESASNGYLSTLEQALTSAGADLANVEWIDVGYQGVVMGSCHGWELQQHAAKIASDLRAGRTG